MAGAFLAGAFLAALGGFTGWSFLSMISAYMGITKGTGLVMGVTFVCIDFTFYFEGSYCFTNF